MRTVTVNYLGRPFTTSDVGELLTKDGSVGAALLLESWQRVDRLLHDHLAGTTSLAELDTIDGSHIHAEWDRLTTEVVEEFVREREIITRKLELKEHRPRNWFAQLPQRGWERVECRSVNEEVEVHRYLFNGQGAASRPTAAAHVLPHLSVLVPITNGYRRTYRTLAGLCYDVAPILHAYSVDFHVCENYSRENTLYEVTRFASTLGQAYAIPVHVYHAEHPRRMPDEERRGWAKTTVLNVMLHAIQRGSTGAASGATAPHYLQFVDDDIFIVPTGKSVIESNIQLLNEQEHASIISAAYASPEDHGFAAISSVRKLPQYVRAAQRLLNLYGGFMTTSVERLRRVVGDELQLPEDGLAEDCILTLMAAYDRKGSYRRDAAYAAPNITVHHSEPTSIVPFAKRVVRDLRWGHLSAKHFAEQNPPLVAAEVEKAFQAARSDSFKPITDAIRNSRNVRHIVAQMWNRAIRDILQHDVDVSADRLQRLNETNEWIHWSTQMTRHQICKTIVEDREIFANVLRVLESAPFGYPLIRMMREAATDPWLKFPQMSALLIGGALREGAKLALSKNPYLYHWHATAVESQAFGQIFPTTHEYAPIERVGTEPFVFDVRDFARIVKPHAGDPETVKQYAWRGLSSSTYGHAAFLQWSSDGTPAEEVYVKYYSVIGRREFLRNSPRRIVYLQVLGSELLKLLVRENGAPAGSPQLHIVETLFPTVALATVSYAGPERQSPFERLTQAVYVQKSLRETTQPLNAPDHKLTQEDGILLADILADFLGRLHSGTIGICPYLRHAFADIPTQRPLPKPKALGKEVRQLLFSHLDQWRMLAPETFHKWLEEGCDPPESIPVMLQHADAEQGIVATEVSRFLRIDQLTLSGIWRTVCEESTRFHSTLGAIGHLGLFASNLLIERGHAASTINAVHVANHSAVGFVDPAIEAGQVLVEVIVARLLDQSNTTNLEAEADDKSLFKIVQRFCDVYAATLNDGISQEYREGLSSLGIDIDVDGLIRRACRMAMLILLSRFNFTREHDLHPAKRTLLVHTCVDLVHVGTTLGLRHREARFQGGVGSNVAPRKSSTWA